MSKKFTEYSKFDLSNVNKEVLKKWKDGDIFHKSLETREGHPTFLQHLFIYVRQVKRK